MKNKKYLYFVYFNSINSMEFTINSGVIDVLVDNKLKHLCLSIGSTVLPTNIRLKEHEYI